MDFNNSNRRALRQGLMVLTALGATVLFGSRGVAQSTPGMSYKLTVTTRPPQMFAMNGGGGGNIVVQAHGVSTALRQRVDIDGIEPNLSTLLIGDYMLMLDSGKTITVSPTNSLYTDKTTVSGLAGMSALMAIMGRGATQMDQLTIGRVQMKLDKLGSGGAIEGQATQHFRVTIDYAIMMQTNEIPIHMVSEFWTADLPIKLRNPIDQLDAIDSTVAGSQQLYAQWAEAKKGVGDGVVLKSITTSSIDISSMGGGGGGMPSIDVTTTSVVSDLKQAAVDDAQFAVPKSFAKAGG